VIHFGAAIRIVFMDRRRLATLDERVLLRLYAEQRRPRDLENELSRRFAPLARSMAMRYRGGSVESDDLMQVASLGLVKALRRYDPERGRFVAFAAPTILGELRRHFRDHSWQLHVPRSLQERSLKVDRTVATLTEELGGSPTTSQIARRLRLDVEIVLDVLQAQEELRSVSLDAPARLQEDGSTTILETIGRESPGFDSVESQLAIDRCAGLDERERAVINMRFIDDQTQREIGERLGVSQMQVSRIMRQGLAKMLEAVQGDEQPDGRRTLTEARPDARFPNGRCRSRVRAAAGTVRKAA